MKIIVRIFVLLVFLLSTKLYAQPSNDNFANAIDVTSIINSCSATAAYTTINATGDLNPGSNWNASPNNNVWFKFVATTDEINVKIKRGSIQGINLAIWENDGTTEINSHRYVNRYDSVSTNGMGLTPGTTYYISVDNYTGWQGTFTLCLADSVDFDLYEGAIDISTDINSCTNTYTTTGATADKNAASTWNALPNNNRWFKFKATTSNIKITVNRSSIQYINAALWESDGLTEITSKRYNNRYDDITIEVVGELTIGNWYYISIDNYIGNYGTFSLCLSDNDISYDYYEGAIELTDLDNWSSADAEFSTYGMTADKNAASTWNANPNNNVWFKFQATTTNIKIVLETQGGKGTIQYINAALWENDGLAEITSERYSNRYDDVTIEVVGELTVGNWYYISVDNYIGYFGSFTLSIADNDVSYDYYEGAIELTDLDFWNSADGEFTTYGMTADKNAASTWNANPNNNVWFKFQATTTNIKITVNRASIQYINAALWESDGTTEVTSKRYNNRYDDVTIEVVGELTIGNWYYISVDNYIGYYGSFSLYIADSDVSYDYYEGAINISSLIDDCSAVAEYSTSGMTADKNAASTWNANPNNNVWFKFQATSFAININILRESIQYIKVALWESDGTTEVSSNRYVNRYDDVTLGSVDLVPGNWYYISVDNYIGYHGTFTLCIDDDVDYDYYEGAQILTNLSDWTSATNAYTTIGATPDKNAASTWNANPNNNRWFKFKATTNQINIEVLRGSIQYINLALWESDGTTEVASNRYVNRYDDVSISALELIPGDWYYISVDNYIGYYGTFTLHINDAADYDYFEGAYEIEDINNWCSVDAEFTTVGATADKNAASCWNANPNYNRWFKFQAVTDGISATVKRGGSLGSIQYINVAIWEADGTTQVACNRYSNRYDNVSVNSSDLTPGNWYYISVDSYIGYRGSFTLCVDDQPSYDYKDGAIELTDLDNWCSADAAYTTSGATADESAASCWNANPNNNRWFKFQAIFDTVSINVRTSGAGETIQYINAALWESDGLTEVECGRYTGRYDDVQITNGDLVPGSWYYISVDNYIGYRGSFSLCVNNVSANVYYAIANGDWGTASTWSKTEGGPAAATSPSSSNKVYLKGYEVTVTSNEAAATIDMDVENDITGLSINGVGASLQVNGNLAISNNGHNYNGTITAAGGGSLIVKNDFLMNRYGGANTFSANIENNSSLNVTNNIIIYSDAGTSNKTTINLSGDGELTVGNDLTLDNSNGEKIKLTLNNSAVLNANRNIEFISTAVDKVEVELNNTSLLNIGENFVRGTPAYGILDCNDNSTVSYKSDSYLQVLSENAGEGIDGFTYQNITINNSKVSSPQITLEGDVTIPGTLTMTVGDIDAGTYTLSVGTDAVNVGSLNHTAGSIIGKYEKWINATSPTSYYLPLGTQQSNNHAAIEFNNLTNGSIISEFITTDPGASGLPIDDNGTTVYDIFTGGYWSITAANSLASNDYNLILDCDGFDSYDFTTDTRLLSRPNSSSDWTVDGSHVNASDPYVYRNNLTNMSAEYGIGDNSCILPTSAITGNDEVPEYAENEDYFVTETSGYTYNWTIIGGDIESGNGSNIIEVNWGADGMGNVAVIASRIGCDAPEVDLDVEIYGPIESNGTGGGSWDNTATWLEGEIPSFNDNVNIKTGDAITLASDVLIRNLTVDGDLDNNGFELTLTGDYTVNGTHTSTGDDKFFLSGVNKNIDGSGTLNIDGRFQITTGNKFILNTADLSINSGVLYIASDIVVYNNGTITIQEQIQGQNANSTWENRVGSTLYTSGSDVNAILATGKLIASFVNNTITYNRLGDQSIKVPVNNEYYNLLVESTNSTLLGDIKVLGDLITDGNFDFDDNNLSLEKSWTMNGSFVQDNGIISLTGSNNQSFSGTYTNISINKSGGEVNLSNTLSISNVLTLTSGNINLGSNNLVITNSASGAISGGSFLSYIQADGTGKVIWDVAVGNTMDFPIGDNNDYSPLTFYLNSGNLASANISLYVTDAKHPNLPVETDYLTRYWTLEESGITNPNYNVSYTYTDDDINGDETILFPSKYSSEWTRGSIPANTGSNTLSWNNITSFSDFTGGSSSALPIELIYFKGHSTNGGVDLNWETATEINNDYFTIERSNDAENYFKIAQIEGVGNSYIKQSYNYFDGGAKNGYQYYRLSQTDYDGTTEMFNVISVLNDLSYNSNTKNLEFYPNPTNKESKPKLKFNGFSKGELILIKVFNNNGMLFYENTIVLKNGFDIVDFSTDYLNNKGLYFFKVISKNTGYHQAIKVIVE